MTGKDRQPCVWGIHAKHEPYLLIERKCIALGWEEIGDLSKMPRERTAFKAAYAKLRKDYGETRQAIANAAGQILRFAWEARIGDYVVYPMPGTRDVHIGRIVGNYRYEPSASIYRQQRRVRWIVKMSRSDVRPDARNSLSCLSTFWKMDGEKAGFFRGVAEGEIDKEPKRSGAELVRHSIYEKLDGVEFENLVADLLRLYGFTVELTGRTGDGGVDIIARRTCDLFTQTAKIQAKCRNTAMGADVLRQLRGALNDGEMGVVFSYSGLTDAARKFAREHFITEVDGDRIAALVWQHRAKLAKRWPQLFASNSVSPYMAS